jgi:hypothetical protein
MDWGSLGLKALEDFDVQIGGGPPYTLYRSLLSIDIGDLLSSQFICFAFRYRCFAYCLSLIIECLI